MAPPVVCRLAMVTVAPKMPPPALVSFRVAVSPAWPPEKPVTAAKPVAVAANGSPGVAPSAEDGTGGGPIEGIDAAGRVEENGHVGGAAHAGGRHCGEIGGVEEEVIGAGEVGIGSAAGDAAGEEVGAGGGAGEVGGVA